MTDFLFREFSGTKFNGVLEVEPGGTLYDIDPSQDQLLAWIEAVANHELVSKGWNNATAGTRLSGKSPVAFTLKRKPEPQLLKQTGIDFPMLALWVNSDTEDIVTLERTQVRTSWGLLWMMGPLNEAEYAKLGAGLRIFRKLLTAAIQARCHGEHDDGALQLDTGQVEFTSLRILRSAYGNVEVVGASDAHPFYGVEFELDSTEVDRDVDGADTDLDGFNVLANSVDPEGSWVAAEGKS